MLMCRQVAKTLADHHYWELPWHRKLGLFIHIRLCIMCGRYHRQLIDFQRGMRGYLHCEDQEVPAPGIQLSTEAKTRILQALSQEQPTSKE
jgi:hypothetical protein